MSLNKVSFIISTLNSGSTLKSCLNSIINQKHKDFEIIIIDGNSSDNTIEIIDGFKEYISYFISEKDDGIYDAWNKALKYVNGDWLCFLGSDDIILENAISNMLSLLETDNSINFISAKVMLVDIYGRDVEIIGKPWVYNNLKNGLGIVHCGALHSISLFENNKFDSKFRIAGDFEFLLRIGKEINSAFLDKVVVRMFNGGSSRKHINLVIYETYVALLNSNKFHLLDSVLFFLNAHIRVLTRTVLLLFLGESIFNKMKFLFFKT